MCYTRASGLLRSAPNWRYALLGELNTSASRNAARGGADANRNRPAQSGTARAPRKLMRAEHSRATVAEGAARGGAEANNEQRRLSTALHSSSKARLLDLPGVQKTNESPTAQTRDRISNVTDGMGD